MTPEQIYFLTLALLNLVIALAGSRINDLDNKPTSIHFLTWGFLAFSISWFIYVFEINVYFKIISAILSLIFIWSILVFSFKRCEKRVPWIFLFSGFTLHSVIQSYFTYKNNFIAVLHVSALVIPIVFILISYLFLKAKKEINSSDTIFAYVYLIMASILVFRSIALLVSSEFFTITTITSQAIWPVFSVAVGLFAFLSFTEEAQKKLKIESITDPLTGILNRRGFINALKDKTTKAWAKNQKLVLVMFDLDHFKKINDTYGHTAGDIVLKKCVQQTRINLRECDLFSRFGGEEFAILLFDVDLKLAEDIVERVRIGLENINLTYKGRDINFTASFGLVELKESGETDNFDETFIKVDNALYDAKGNGRNRISVRF